MTPLAPTQHRRGETVEIPVYDFSTHSRSKAITVAEPRQVIIVEGILIFSDMDLVKELGIKVGRWSRGGEREKAKHKVMAYLVTCVARCLTGVCRYGSGCPIDSKDTS